MTNCDWSQLPEGVYTYDNTWVTSCGDEFILNEGAPKENGFKYCPYCGDKIKEIDYETDD